MNHKHPAQDSSSADPALAGLGAQLAVEENVLCTLVVDLDQQLCFADSRLVLTDRRLLVRSPEGAWSGWPLTKSDGTPAQGLTLRHFDHAGVGTLELHELDVTSSKRLASWRFTLGTNVQALRLVRLFAQQQAARPGAATTSAATDDLPLCPECDLPLPPDSDECPACARKVHTPPSTWVLFRLWRFARPYRFQLLSGFLLTLASTAATLVAPYLTIPLMTTS